MRLDQIELGLRKLPGVNAFLLYPEEVEVLWELLEPLFDRSVRVSQGTMSLEGLRMSLLKGHVQGIVVLDGDSILSVFAARIIEYETYRACRIIAAAGIRMREAMERLEILTTWALAHDAVEVEGWCRPGMARLLRRYKFRTKFELVSLDIRRTLQ